MSRLRAKQFIFVAAAAVLLVGAAFSASTALAAKPGAGGAAGGGKHGRGGGQPTGACVISPNPLPYRTYGTLTGSGFAPNTSVGYTVTASSGTAMGFVGTDDRGGFTISTYGGWLGTSTVTFTGGATCSVNVV